MKIVPLASESLGVRSMAIYVETGDVGVLFDAGASLAPRFGLMPHPFEYGALREARERIRAYSEKAEVITLSHYHFDHYTPTWDEPDGRWTWGSMEEARAIYKGKLLLAKDRNRDINASQRRRAYVFEKRITWLVEGLEYCDGKAYEFGGSRLVVSAPMPHGDEGSRLGFVLFFTLTDGNETFMFCPDTQGPVSERAKRYILEVKPDFLAIGGPPIYLAPSKIPQEVVEKGLNNLKELASEIGLMLVEHHMLRDERALELVEELKRWARSNGNEVSTYAEFLGRKDELLEARRQKLYEEHPPSDEFLIWAERRERSPPPL